jgi:hypothetical protein
MTLTLYHRTNIGEARVIVIKGFEDRDWNFGLFDARTGDEVSVEGVWLVDRPVRQDEGLDGDALLEVTVHATLDELAPFELDGMLWDARIWVVPAQWLAERARVRFHAVDPHASGFFEAPNGELES